MKYSNSLAKAIALSVGVLAMVVFITFISLAWTEPGSAPPAGNVSAPLNVGVSTQNKLGWLTFEGGGTRKDTYLATVSGNVGIGTTIPGVKLDISGDVRWTGTLQGGAVPWARLTTVPAGFADGVDNTGGIAVETDPTVTASVKDGVSWGEVSAIPAGFADGVDNTGIAAESDPTVPASVKDGVSWGEVSGRPSYSCGAANQGLKTIDLNTGAVSCETDDIVSATCVETNTIGFGYSLANCPDNTYRLFGSGCTCGGTAPGNKAFIVMAQGRYNAPGGVDNFFCGCSTILAGAVTANARAFCCK